MITIAAWLAGSMRLTLLAALGGWSADTASLGGHCSPVVVGGASDLNHDRGTDTVVLSGTQHRQRRQRIAASGPFSQYCRLSALTTRVQVAMGEPGRAGRLVLQVNPAEVRLLQVRGLEDLCG